MEYEVIQALPKEDGMANLSLSSRQGNWLQRYIHGCLKAHPSDLQRFAVLERMEPGLKAQRAAKQDSDFGLELGDIFSTKRRHTHHHSEPHTHVGSCQHDGGLHQHDHGHDMGDADWFIRR